ncbi:40-residue YVTN family beta-propeller repeat-containing protein [Azotobacter beijerinckii]|uniref:40-residue YVTN family beta-propeller repeat-containing protein n=1 Tax=Azotobacter beijerinckii TaxID=170623 RepID=A0A1H6XTB2_9GAMM|nr:choice-of-anchor I family protein [Azotobacter beijerinckii]SEJ29997.1 40-residue YVTN family beta-propeller repeat-containing protein [Azotobacter beijerinckii]
MAVDTAFESSVYRQFDSGSGEAGSEVVAFESGQLFVTNGADERIDIFDTQTGTKIGIADASSIPGFAGINSVTVSNGLIAVAVTRTTLSGETTVLDRGVVAFFNVSGQRLNTIEVGYGPDMVTFSPDGSQVFVANEGEPSASGDSNPGSVSVIDLSQGVAAATHTEIDFATFDGQEEALREQGVRIFPDQSASEDFEPEYIAFSPDGQTAYVTLQEANAVATIDMATLNVSALLPLGTVDHRAAGSGVDASDKDGTIDIANWPVQGLRMPDAIASYAADDKTYFVVANEGDDRGENVRVKDIALDSSAFPDAASLQENANLGRLNVSSIDGDTDGDGDYDALYSYGGRSFSIFDAEGNLVFDSGDDFEQIIASLHPESFNIDSDEPDARSDNKGPEPEALAIGRLGDRTYAFIGLERDSGIMVYDVTDPAGSTFVSYIDSAANGDLAPEVIKLIDGGNSASGKPQLAVAYEISGTTTLIDIDQIGTDDHRTVFGSDTGAAFLERLYDGLLARDSDAAGLGFWMDQLEADISHGQIAESFLQSAEATDGGLNTLNDTDFVNHLYQSVLARDADTDGLAFWRDGLAAGVQRADVAVGIVGSAEAIEIFASEGAQGVSYDLWAA